MSRRAAVVIAVMVLVLPAAAQRRDRASIPEKYKWDLTHIYPSERRLARGEGHALLGQ